MQKWKVRYGCGFVSVVALPELLVRLISYSHLLLMVLLVMLVGCAPPEAYR